MEGLYIHFHQREKKGSIKVPARKGKNNPLKLRLGERVQVKDCFYEDGRVPNFDVVGFKNGMVVLHSSIHYGLSSHSLDELILDNRKPGKRSWQRWLKGRFITHTIMES